MSVLPPFLTSSLTPSHLPHTLTPSLRHRLEAGLGGTVEANMKKESKTYSFEDQKWDAEVRAEQLLKRKDAIQKEDISTLIRQAKLTPKQQVCGAPPRCYNDDVMMM